MSKTPRQKPKPAEIELAPEQDFRLGDLTPEYIVWHKANHSEAEHLRRYRDRIPHEYAETFGIERV